MLREGQSLVKYNSWLRWQQGRCKLEYLTQKTVILHEFKFSAGINFQVFAYYYCDDHIKSVLRVSQSTFVELLVTHAMGGLLPQSKLKQKNENKLKKTRRRERKNTLGETASNKFYIKLLKWMVNYKNFFTASCRVIFTLRFLYISILHF